MTAAGIRIQGAVGIRVLNWETGRGQPEIKERAAIILG